MTKPVVECLTNLVYLLEPVQDLTNKVRPIISPKRLPEVFPQGTRYPVCGVLYEGTRPNTSGRDGAPQINVTNEMVFSLWLLADEVIKPGADTMPRMHNLLDEMRRCIHGVQSPTGHKWKFLAEAAAGENGNKTLWLQRWGTNIQLPPAPPRRP